MHSQHCMSNVKERSNHINLSACLPIRLSVCNCMCASVPMYACVLSVLSFVDTCYMRQQSFRLDLACASQGGGGGAKATIKDNKFKVQFWLHGTFRKLGYLILGPYNKDPTK